MPVTIGGKSPKGRSHPGPILPPCTDPASSHSIGSSSGGDASCFPLNFDEAYFPKTCEALSFSRLTPFLLLLPENVKAIPVFLPPYGS